MARLIPALGTVAFATRGELRVAEALEAQLDDDYFVYSHVAVGRPPRFPDFLILHAALGLLALEVKDWKLEQILPGSNAREFRLDLGSGPLVKPNPLMQCRAALVALLDMLDRDPLLKFAADHVRAGNRVFAWAYGVVLPYLTRAQFDAADIGAVIDPHLVVCKDELGGEAEVFQRRLWQMFNHRQHAPLGLAQIDRLRWHIFPDIRVGSQRQAVLPLEDTAPDIVRVMDRVQEQLARGLGEGHRVIHGVAGSGKTAILVFRCLHLARLMQRPILVLCFNKPIAERLRQMLAARHAGDHVHVYHFHGWCAEQLRVAEGRRLAADGETAHDALVQATLRLVASGRIARGQYGAVLIDEAHDFQDDWLRLAVAMVDPSTDALLVKYEDAQSIFRRARNRKFSFASVGIKARGRTQVLRLNYRNTAQILHLARSFAAELLHDATGDDDAVPVLAPESAGRQRPLPVLRQCADAAAQAALIARELTVAHDDGLAWADKAVLANSTRTLEAVAVALAAAGLPHQVGKRSDNRFDFSADSVSLVTLHACKGLEFSFVVIAGVDELPHPGADSLDEARLLYVGLTRATERLLLTCRGQSAFTRRLAAALASEIA
jgi:hypothetical protein